MTNKPRLIPTGFFDPPPDVSHFDSNGEPSRYAYMIRGFDLDGRLRCLVLTWDGMWHPASPTTGNFVKRADTVFDDERIIHDGKVILRMPGAFVPPGHPPRVVFYREDGHTDRVVLPCDMMLEVLP